MPLHCAGAPLRCAFDAATLRGAESDWVAVRLAERAGPEPGAAAAPGAAATGAWPRVRVLNRVSCAGHALAAFVRG